MIRKIVLVVVMLALAVSDGYAGGAAAAKRRPRGGQVRRNIQLTPPPPQAAPPPEEREKSAAPPKAAPVYAPGRVLSSEDSSSVPSSYSVPSVSAQPLTPEDQKNLEALYTRFDQSSELWAKLPDPRVKAAIIQHYIELYGQFQIYINKPAAYYVTMIDSMAQGDPSMLQTPMDQVLRVVAIIEYDYDDGQNKDALAKSILQNEASFRANRQRLGME